MRRCQVTCKCSAYDFPHRIGGGKCSGGGWCASYREIDGEICSSCNCCTDSGCDVEDGLESVKHADCALDELRSEIIKDTYGKLPIEFECFLEIQYNLHYQYKNS